MLELFIKFYFIVLDELDFVTIFYYQNPQLNAYFLELFQELDILIEHRIILPET